MRISDWSSDVCSSDLAAVCAALEEAVREHRLHLLPWPEVARALQARGGFARGHDSTLRDLSDETTARSIAAWLPPLIQNIRRRSEKRLLAKECVSTCISAWSRYHDKQHLKKAR